MNTFFTSDTHFHHSKAAEMRGFESVGQMNDALVAAWNKKVPKDAFTYHLGDLSFAGKARTYEIIDRLNGTIYLVPGNHDESVLKALADHPKVVLLEPLIYRKFNIAQPDGTNIVVRIAMSHYPMFVWRSSHHGSIHLHGHSHGNLRYPHPPGSKARIFDVGVDCAEGYAPFSFSDIMSVMSRTAYAAFDHHKEHK
jgi:calcineurin-like phosphoesterase family protein